MTPLPLPPPLLALIPGLASHLATIMSGLRAVLLVFHKPELAPLIRPASWRLNHLAVRLQRLLALLAAGGRPRQWPPRPGRARAASPSLSPDQIAQQAPTRLLPTRKAWLLRAWEGKVVIHRNQLYDLLRQPGMSELLAAEPAIGRLLAPVFHMLGLPEPGVRIPDPKPPPRWMTHPTTPPPVPVPTDSERPLSRTEQWSREWNRLKAR